MSKRERAELVGHEGELDAVPTSFRRQEKKYSVRLRPFDAAVAEIDKVVPTYCFRGNHHVSCLRTTYFDTADLRIYREYLQKRSVRRKIRVREYGYDHEYDPLCWIELKMKDHGISTKFRFALPREMLEAFLEGEDVWADVRACNPAKGLEQVYTALRSAVLAEELGPLLQVRYNRVSFERQEDSTSYRLTLDRDLEFELLGAGVVYPMDVLIMEEKVDGPAPAWREDLLARVRAKRMKRFSKYANAVEYLSSVPRAAEYLSQRARFPTVPVSAATAVGLTS